MSDFDFPCTPLYLSLRPCANKTTRPHVFFPHADPRACLNGSQSKLGSALEPNKSFHTCSVLRIPFKFPSIRKNTLLVVEKRDDSSCVLMQGRKENRSK